MNNIIFKGVNSNSLTGLLISALPPITKPNMRISEEVVDGRDGSVITELGYSAYDKVVSIGLYGNYDINAIINFFRGEGNIIFSNENDKYYKARCDSQIDFARLVRFRTANVRFKVQPFKYKVNETDVTLSTSGSVMNLGNMPSKPIIQLNGTGSVEFKIGGVTIFSYEFPTGETSVIIDSEMEDAHLSDGTLRNRQMTGEFPVLAVGSNAITTSGSVTSIVISPKSRWL